MTGLGRFVRAQDPVYDQVLSELRAGRKTSHWMWFIFPQLAWLGRSPTARHFGLDGLDEARAYLADPVLGPRLAECAGLMLRHRGTAPEAILGATDAMKLRSSATLFEAAGGGEVFASIIEAFYGGSRCGLTLGETG